MVMRTGWVWIVIMFNALAGLLVYASAYAGDGVYGLTAVYVLMSLSMIVMIRYYPGNLTYALLASFMVWEASLQKTMPLLPRIFTPGMIIALWFVSGAWRVKLHQGGTFLISLLAMALIGITRELVNPPANTSGLSYSLMLLAAAALVQVFAAGRREHVHFTLSVLIGLAVSSGFYAFLNIAYAVGKSYLNLAGLIADDRLGNFSMSGANSLAYVYGVGFIASLFAWWTLGRDAFSHWLLLFAFINVLAVVATKTISVFIAISVVAGLLVFRGFSTKPVLSVVMIAVIGLLCGYAVETYQFRDYESFGRMAIWELVFTGIQKYPFLGVPFDKLDVFLPIITYTYGGIEYDSYLATPHNMFLANMLYYGVPAGAMFIVGSLHALRKVHGALDAHRVEYGYAAMALMILTMATHMGIDAWYTIALMPYALCFAEINALDRAVAE